MFILLGLIQNYISNYYSVNSSFLVKIYSNKITSHIPKTRTFHHERTKKSNETNFGKAYHFARTMDKDDISSDNSDRHSLINKKISPRRKIRELSLTHQYKSQTLKPGMNEFI